MARKVVPETFALRDFLAKPKFDPEVLLRRNAAYPRISIVMPSFNQAQFIERSILSVLNQNYPNLEFIIIDGGSTDGTADIITKYKMYLAYCIREPDNGQSDALNKGFARATGEIYGWLNSDDLYMPGAFDWAVAAFEKYPGKSIAYGDWLTINTRDHIIAHEYAFDFNLNQLKYEGAPINAQAMFWRRDVHERFGSFDPNLCNTMDYQMLLAFGHNEGKAVFLRVPKVLGCFRRYAGQKTGNIYHANAVNEHRFLSEHYDYADKYSAVGGAKRLLYRCRRAYWYLQRGGFSYFLGKFAGSQELAPYINKLIRE